ncbi:MAG: thiol-disulfide oxidoreductase DCC family protein [Gemmatimonadota bacterium]
METGVSIASPQTSVILFDAACPLCTGSARFIVRNDPENRFRFAALQSPAGRTLASRAGVPEARSPDASIAVLSGGVWLSGSDAALEIASQLKWPWSLLGLLRALPAGLRDRVYRFVARNRPRSASICAAGHDLDARMLRDGVAAGDGTTV